MHRLFLDANILFSAAYRPHAGLLQFWKLKDTILCSSHYAMEEAALEFLTGRHAVARKPLVVREGLLFLRCCVPGAQE